MYNYKLSKVDPISLLKYSTLFAVSISAVTFVLDILLLVIKLISTLFTKGHPLIVLEHGGIQLFFTFIVLMIISIAFGLISMMLSIVYNYSSKWFDGIKVHVDEFQEVQTDENVNNSKQM